MAKAFAWDRWEIDTGRYGAGHQASDGNYVLAEDAINREAVNADRIRTLELQLKEARADARDAARYRWLRRQYWNEADMFVVAGSKSQIRLGTYCPSLELLDDAIDTAAPAQGGQVSDLFYLQDSRSYVGNDVLWWANLGEGGYTTDLRKARVFTKEDAQAHHDSRETDIPWPKEYIDAKTRPAMDMQYIKRDDALRGTGIILANPPKPRAYTFNCQGCGRFLNDVDRYSRDCPKCGADNRP